jgi:hypothetical protein
MLRQVNLPPTSRANRSLGEAARDRMSMAEERVPAYHEYFASLHDIVLEESWVHGLDTSIRQLLVRLDLVLTPAHPYYRPSGNDEAFCYRRGALVVDSDTAVILRRSTSPPAVDATGELDHGHIDAFCPAPDLGDNVWELHGEWGEALVRQPRVQVTFDMATID